MSAEFITITGHNGSISTRDFRIDYLMKQMHETRAFAFINLCNISVKANYIYSLIWLQSSLVPSFQDNGLIFNQSCCEWTCCWLSRQSVVRIIPGFLGYASFTIKACRICYSLWNLVGINACYLISLGVVKYSCWNKVYVCLSWTKHFRSSLVMRWDQV